MILRDREIRELAEAGMIDPFEPNLVSKGAISWGLSSFGYDARLADEFRVFSNHTGEIIDPKRFKEDCWIECRGSTCIVPPNSLVLGRTVEYFRMPEDVMAICVGKSTYARCGVIVNVTPLEPGWEGEVTLEISNTAPLPVRIHAGEGICQFLFLRGSRPDVTYADRGGKYMHQSGVVPPRIDGT